MSANQHRREPALGSEPVTAPFSRRSFVRAGAGIAAMAAAGVAPRVLRADDKAGEKKLVVGKDQHTYEVVDDWAKLPEGKTFGNTHAVQEAADGRIIVHHTGPESVCVFDPDGKFIESWGKEYAGNAHGLDLRKEGNEEFLYLTPTGMHKVFKTNLKGEVLLTLDYPKEAKNAAGQPAYDGPNKYVPTFTAFAPNGDFYVTDGYGSFYVHRYNLKGEYQNTFGGPGSGEGQLAVPHGIWYDTREANNPMVLVADRSNVRLQWFTPEGKYVKMVKEELRHPCHFSQRGDDILIPDLHGRVTIFGKDNKLITHLGDNPNAAQRGQNSVKKEALVPGAFCTPHGATWDKAGNIYVAEWLPYGRVTKLRRVSGAA